MIFFENYQHYLLSSQGCAWPPSAVVERRCALVTRAHAEDPEHVARPRPAGPPTRSTRSRPKTSIARPGLRPKDRSCQTSSSTCSCARAGTGLSATRQTRCGSPPSGARPDLLTFGGRRGGRRGGSRRSRQSWAESAKPRLRPATARKRPNPAVVFHRRAPPQVPYARGDGLGVDCSLVLGGSLLPRRSPLRRVEVPRAPKPGVTPSGQGLSGCPPQRARGRGPRDAGRALRRRSRGCRRGRRLAARRAPCRRLLGAMGGVADIGGVR